MSFPGRGALRGVGEGAVKDSPVPSRLAWRPYVCLPLPHHLRRPMASPTPADLAWSPRTRACIRGRRRRRWWEMQARRPRCRVSSAWERRWAQSCSSCCQPGSCSRIWGQRRGLEAGREWAQGTGAHPALLLRPQPPPFQPKHLLFSWGAQDTVPTPPPHHPEGAPNPEFVPECSSPAMAAAQHTHPPGWLQGDRGETQPPAPGSGWRHTSPGQRALPVPLSPGSGTCPEDRDSRLAQAQRKRPSTLV